MPGSRPGVAGLLALGISLAAAGGCGLYRADADLKKSAEVLPERYPARHTGGATGALDLDRYWRAFGSETLNRLVEAAMEGNHDLRSATARVREAGFGARVAWSDRFPAIDYDLSLAYSGRNSEAVTQTRAPGWTARIGVAATYEIDLWGRLRSEHKSALAELEAARWDQQTVRMTLAAEVTLRWLEVRASRAQLALLDSQARVVGRTAGFLEQRYRQGGVPLTDLLAQRQTLASIKAARSEILRNLDTALAELRLLLGSSKVAPEIVEVTTLPALPPLPDAGLPARLVQRRPDVQAAWQELLAAAWSASAAQARRLPELRIAGTFAFAASNPAELFQSWIASALAGITGPLFDFFGRKYAAQEAAAAADVAREELAQMLLEAFRDVERALVANRHLSARAAALAATAEIAEDRAERLTFRYRNGTGNYLELYVAELALINAQQSLLLVRADLLAQRVQLARALGGGWNTPPEDAGSKQESGQ